MNAPAVTVILQMLVVVHFAFVSGVLAHQRKAAITVILPSIIQVLLLQPSTLTEKADPPACLPGLGRGVARSKNVG